MSEDLGLRQTLGVLLGVGILIGGLFCLGGYLSRCQHCDKWFSQRTVARVKVKEEAGVKDVERADRHYDREGLYAGETRRKERVYGKFITYDVTLGCGRCGSQHHETRVEWRDS
jgi:ribosomal protein L44E